MGQQTRTSTTSRHFKALMKIARAKITEAAIETLRDTARSVIGCEGTAIILKDGDLCPYVEEDAIGPLWKGRSFQALPASLDGPR